LPVADYDRTDRDFTDIERALGTTQSLFHPELVRDGLRILARALWGCAGG
jgi:hypothetical protein